MPNLLNINTYTKPIKRAAENIGLGGVYDALSGASKAVGEVAPYILPFVPGAAFSGLGGLGTTLASPMGRAALGGVAGTFANGRPNLKQGLMSGLTTYGLSAGYQGLQAAGGSAAPAGLSEEAGRAISGASNLMSGNPVLAEGAKTALGEEAGRGALTAGYMGVTGLAALDDQEKYLDQLKAAGKISDDLYAKKKAQIAAARESATKAMNANPYRLARGGSVPRFVSGPGDGMSDSIPANIDGHRPARLTDGEFVIPADVVSHLGNGSSKAGAQQLYAMMDRVRKARTGSAKQGRQINASRMMPV
jgi:hypothetical protein